MKTTFFKDLFGLNKSEYKSLPLTLLEIQQECSRILRDIHSEISKLKTGHLYVKEDHTLLFKKNISGSHKGMTKKALTFNTSTGPIVSRLKAYGTACIYFLGALIGFIVHSAIYISILLLYLARLVLSPLIALPYFTITLGMKKGLSTYSRFLLTHILMIPTVVMTNMLIRLPTLLFVALTQLLLVPLIRRRAIQQVEEFNREHPLIQALLDALTTNNQAATRIALNAILSSDELAEHEKKQYLKTITQTHLDALNRNLERVSTHSELLTHFPSLLQTLTYFRHSYSLHFFQDWHSSILTSLSSFIQEADEEQLTAFSETCLLFMCEHYSVYQPQIDLLLEKLIALETSEYTFTIPEYSNKGDLKALITRLLLNSCQHIDAALTEDDLARSLNEIPEYHTFTLLGFLSEFLSLPYFIIPYNEHENKLANKLIKLHVHQFIQTLDELDLSIEINTRRTLVVLIRYIKLHDIFDSQTQTALYMSTIRALIQKPELIKYLMKNDFNYIKDSKSVPFAFLLAYLWEAKNDFDAGLRDAILLAFMENEKLELILLGQSEKHTNIPGAFIQHCTQLKAAQREHQHRWGQRRTVATKAAKPETIPDPQSDVEPDDSKISATMRM